MAVGHRERDGGIPADAAGDPEVDGGDGNCKARWQLDIGKPDAGIPADAARIPDVHGDGKVKMPDRSLTSEITMTGFPPMPLEAPCSFSGSRRVSLHDPAGSTSASIEEVLHRAATANSDRRLTSGTAMAAFRPMPSASPDVHGDGRVAKSDGSGTSGNAMLAFPPMPLATPRSTAATGGAKPDGSWTSGNAMAAFPPRPLATP